MNDWRLQAMLPSHTLQRIFSHIRGPADGYAYAIIPTQLILAKISILWGGPMLANWILGGGPMTFIWDNRRWAHDIYIGY
jgi:hypothetical protein